MKTAVLAACAACTGVLVACGGPSPGGFAHHRAGLLPPRPIEIAPGGGPRELARLAIEPGGGFTELVASFNADVGTGGAAWAEARVETARGWSPWLRLAEWGDVDRLGEAGPVSFDSGRVAIDELLLESPAARAEVRVLGVAPAALHRLDATASRPVPGARLAPSPGRRSAVEMAYIPNAEDDPDLRSRLCSPTSLNMLLNQRVPGIEHASVVAASHDPRHDLFGVWPRAIQAAWTHGVPGYLARFGGWREVRHHLEHVGPMAISITAKPGEVRNMPYESDSGHLIVLYGLTETGDAMVLDPALREEADARRIYAADDLTLVWLQRKRGTAYVLLPPDRTASVADDPFEPAPGLTEQPVGLVP